MTSRQIAKMIPPEYRKEIIDTGIINNAIAAAGDPGMHYLGTIWKNYIAPDEDLTCGLCLERVLSNFRNMAQDLVDLEREYQLMKYV